MSLRILNEGFIKKYMKPMLNESADISEYQKWVDYDMKKYHRISDDTMKQIKDAGFSVVRDQYGDYEVIADRKDECYNNINEMARMRDIDNPKLQRGTKVKLNPKAFKKYSSEPQLRNEDIASLKNKIGTVKGYWIDYTPKKEIFVGVDFDGTEWAFGVQDLIVVKDTDRKDESLKKEDKKINEASNSYSYGDYYIIDFGDCWVAKDKNGKIVFKCETSDEVEHRIDELTEALKYSKKLNKSTKIKEAVGRKLSRSEIDEFYKNLPEYIKTAQDYLKFFDGESPIFAVCFAVIGDNFIDVHNGYPLFYGIDSEDYQMQVDQYCRNRNITRSDVLFKTIYNPQFKETDTSKGVVEKEANMKKDKNEGLAEDFDEKNINKMGTREYEANTGRKRRIERYRKFANLNEDEEITADNINEWALEKTATYSNRHPDQIRAEILGERYSDYEI